MGDVFELAFLVVTVKIVDCTTGPLDTVVLLIGDGWVTVLATEGTGFTVLSRVVTGVV